MDEINEWLRNPVLFCLAVLVFYLGKRAFDLIFDYLVKKTKTDYVSKEEFIANILEIRRAVEQNCKFNRDTCFAHRNESLAWLEPTMKKMIRQNVEVKKLIHLIGTKMGLDEQILASLINGDSDSI